MSEQTLLQSSMAPDPSPSKPWRSEITEVERNKLKTHGINQEEIIRDFSYEEMVFFLLKGHRPTVVERTLLRSVIVSHVSHGITGQSTLAVRMAADTGASFLHALIAGFSVGAGIYHQGNLEATMKDLAYFTSLREDEVEPLVMQALSEKKRLMGFGHRFHKDSDPRAETLSKIADELGHVGPHFMRARQIGNILMREKGLPMNIEAVGGALLLDIGIDPRVAHLIIVIGRGPMFAAAYLERLAQNTSPFPKIVVFDKEEPK